MLTKQLKYLFSVLSAMYFLLAGTGYNIIEYCCDDCAHEGIEFVANHSCETIHHGQQHDCCDLDGIAPFANNANEHLQVCTNDNSCQIIRIQLDDYSVVNETVNSTPSTNDLFVELNANSIVSGLLTYAEVLHEYSPPHHLFVQSGREILTNKSVLVI